MSGPEKQLMRLTFPRLFASDVYGRTDKVGGKSCRPLFDAGSVEAGGERSAGDRISLSDFRFWAATKFCVVGASKKRAWCMRKVEEPRTAGVRQKWLNFFLYPPQSDALSIGRSVMISQQNRRLLQVFKFNLHCINTR